MTTYKATKPILINLDLQLVKSLDDAAHRLGMNRTDIIRKCLSRDIQYVLQVEVPKSAKLKQELNDHYPTWMNRYANAPSKLIGG